MKVKVCTEEVLIPIILNLYVLNAIQKTAKKLYPEKEVNISNLDLNFNKGIIEFTSGENNSIEYIELCLVSPAVSKGQPFPDILIYIYEDQPTDYPNCVIEITKNDCGDSGNMCYQRLEKFLYLLMKYGEEIYDQIDKTLLYYITMPNGNPDKNTPWKISKRLCSILGISVKINRLGIEEPENIDQSDFKTLVNSTKKGAGTSNRIYIDNDTKLIEIHSNLIKNKKISEEKSEWGDPNIGFVTAMCYCLHRLYPDYNLVLCSHNLYDKQINSKSKFWTVLYPLREKILIDKDWDAIDINTHKNSLYYKETTGEKIGSLCIHYKYHDKVIFHNHAGGEKSNFTHPFTKKEHKSLIGKGIPDLILVSGGELREGFWYNVTLIVIEGEQNKPTNIKDGIKQIQNDFPDWIKKNIKDKWSDIDWNSCVIKYKLCTSGGDNHPDQESCEGLLGYSITNQGYIYDTLFND